MSDVYTVEIKFDPTSPRTMRWGAEITKDGRYVRSIHCAATRRSAERQARRHIRNLPGRRSYTLTISKESA